MSTPPPYPQQPVPDNVAMKKEDCRDYLRTGRCKYGASCKYNHPANVQSGGGMKAPLNPSEPMFPVRPNEPVCQYYMKHGTCKFGQACKFHHPPPSQLSAMAGAGPMLGRTESPQMLWNGDSNVQMLPQRPDEPNCIFFLKNGRCKYGATCRYHHPLNYHDRRTIGPGEEGMRRQAVPIQPGDNNAGSQIHYVTSLPPGSYQQGHFVVADGAVTFLSLDGSPAQVISVPQGNKDTVVYTSAPAASSRPLGTSRDMLSSSSSASIASSYETANSNLDAMGAHGDSASSLWNRSNRSGSANSLTAYNTPHVVPGGRTVLVQNVSDPNMGLPRVVSTASAASDGGTVYYETSPGIARHPMPPQGQVPNGAMWKNRRSNSFDHAGQGTSYNAREEGVYEGAPQSVMHEAKRSPMARGRPPQAGRRRAQQPREVDEGLSMMTSALLTMLDTPEEANAEGYDAYDEQQVAQGSVGLDYNFNHPNQHGNQAVDPRMYGNDHIQGGQDGYYDQNGFDDHLLGLSMPEHRSRGDPQYGHKEPPQPNQEYGSWQNHAPAGRSFQGTAQPLSMIPAQSTNNSTHNASNVGLYLP